MVNILQEFEKRYKGDPSQTEKICERIAFENGLDTDTVTDYVYLNRYESDPDDFESILEEDDDEE